ncbi:histidinol-phosphatase HisJ [Mesobacillus jeotgali]|jgi:histidinol-phosphatase (PHP family)|uniref:Histidinol-phosphatase n=1 Tax=Mesobacillus jeotgali TaxID=129985 RepID=A0ABY9VGR1_9BACI|nr:histidinol-phosphatase HisJ [Mesobacillus jeotgali]WNF22041.1 histidinol-phosphatase HisJ [Mesobacillus jeotgali]
MKDGHVHTSFCPHGTKDSLDDYIQRALELGYTEITFAEHAPLPQGFLDPTPMKDSAMRYEDLDRYFQSIEEAKASYRGKIKINTGFEIDYIEGYEIETANLLNKFGPRLDDAVLSVHFLKNPDGSYSCLDYSPDNFGEMVKEYGSVKDIHRHYYQTVLKSIHADLGPYKPKRIGHITLANKFRLKYPIEKDCADEIFDILETVSKQGYELDYNGAGTAKPLCREPYPPDWVVREAKKLGIKLVYGSDAHQAKELGQGLDRMLVKK